MQDNFEKPLQPVNEHNKTGGEKTKVYDLPTRYFHWTFGPLFVLAFFIANNLGDESPFFVYHMFAGLTVAFLLLLRIVWAFVGSRYARFRSWRFSPIELFKYFIAVFSKKTERHLGHNVASSYSALVIIVCAVVLATTGVLMTSAANSGDAIEGVHETFSKIFIITTALHIVGVIFHQIRHWDGVGLAMFTGKKNKIEGKEGIKKSYSGVGMAYLLLLVLFMGNLFYKYDANTQQLSLLGLTLNLSTEDYEYGEEGQGKNAENEKEQQGVYDDDDDDDDDD